MFTYTGPDGLKRKVFGVDLWNFHPSDNTHNKRVWARVQYQTLIASLRFWWW